MVRRTLRLPVLLLATGIAVADVACGGGVVALGGPADISDGGTPGTAPDGSIPPSGTLTHADKVDLLLMIDNSASMGDKQELLLQAVPDLVDRLLNPFCVDASGATLAKSTQGACAQGKAPPGLARRRRRSVRRGGFDGRSERDQRAGLGVRGETISRLGWGRGRARNERVRQRCDDHIHGLHVVRLCRPRAGPRMPKARGRGPDDEPAAARLLPSGGRQPDYAFLLHAQAVWRGPPVPDLALRPRAVLRESSQSRWRARAVRERSFAVRSVSRLPPLFSTDLPTDSSQERCKLAPGPRSPNLVVYMAITGVPNALLAPTLDDAAWTRIVGKDPEHYDYTGMDVHMVQSRMPRAGLRDPTAADTADPANGREWDTGLIDLQYACTFEVSTPRNCKDPKYQGACDCTATGSDPRPPLCAANPADSGNLTLQVRGKAYPGIRELAVARGLGERGIVASICPTTSTRPAPSTASAPPCARSAIAWRSRSSRQSERAQAMSAAPRSTRSPFAHASSSFAS